MSYSVSLAVQENSEIVTMLDSKAGSSKTKPARKKSDTKQKSAKIEKKSFQKTNPVYHENCPPQTAITVHGNDITQLPGNDVTQKQTLVRRRLRLTPERKEAMRRATKRALQKMFVFLVSTVGLSCVVVAYAIVGGFIFMNLEGNSEQVSREAIKEIREQHVQRLMNITWTMNVFKEDEWMLEANNTFLSFQGKIYDAVKDMGWDGSDVVSTNTRWNYAGSLLFSVTVITTIGFGHLTPVTFWGRMVTIFYGLIGIPMTLLCLANIGAFMAHCFRLLWSQIICQPCRRHLRRRSLHMAAKKAAAAKFVGDMAMRNRLLPPGAPAGGARFGTVAAGPSASRQCDADPGSESPAIVHDSASLLGRPPPPRYSSLDHGERGRFLTGIDGFSGRDSVSSDLQDHQEKERLNIDSCESGLQDAGDDKQHDDKSENISQSNEQEHGGEQERDTKDSVSSWQKPMEGAVCSDEKSSTNQEPEEKKHERVGCPQLPESSVYPDQRKKYLQYSMVTATVLQEPEHLQPSTVAVDEVQAVADANATESLMEIKKLKETEVVRVPITVCLVIMAAYICLGAMLFSLWEQNWTYFDSCYFCFTTLSTIGFGDLVPGYDNKQWGNQAKRVSCTLYLLFGLALVAMSFELIQAECRQMFKQLARAIGFALEEKTHGVKSVEDTRK